MRLDKFISNNTLYSRKEVSKIIRLGRVKVNNLVIKDTSFHINSSDSVSIDNNPINKIDFFYIVMNKPKGYVCSNSNIDGESVLNLIDPIFLKDIHIVGRLDKDTTGLVLLTNDGSFTHKIKSPKSNVEKEYEVELSDKFTKQMHDTLKSGIKLDNKIIKPFEIKNIRSNKINIVLCEGKYHQIKRMFAIVNNPVINLNRIRINNFILDEQKIPLGSYILIKKEDILL